VGIVGKDVKFRLLSTEELRAHIAEINDAMDVAE
jgi:hypothetical protein